MFVILLAVAMMASGVRIGLKHYAPGISMASSFSTVISAACHLEDETVGSEMAVKGLRWGVTRSGRGFSVDEVGRCAQQHSLYAGKSK